MPSSAFTWSVEQSGHATSVGDSLLTVFCTGGDGCHLETQARICIFILSYLTRQVKFM